MWGAVPGEILQELLAEARVQLREDALDERLVEDLLDEALERARLVDLDRDHALDDAVKVVDGELVEQRREGALLRLLRGVVALLHADPALALRR